MANTARVKDWTPTTAKETTKTARTTPNGGQCAEVVFMPLEERGTCVVCLKSDLGPGSWCYGCGVFVCVTHDTDAQIPIGKAHSPLDHGHEPGRRTKGEAARSVL